MAKPIDQCAEPGSVHSSSSTLCDNPRPVSCPTTFPKAPQPCAHRRWCNTLSCASQKFSASLPTFTSHLSSLHTYQKRAHRLARNCTLTWLHPNPASSNTKRILQVRLTTLLTDIDTDTKLHDIYSAALMLYTFPVQAVVNDLKISKVRCQCFDCTTKDEKWTAEMNTAIEKEAYELLGKIEDTNVAFKELDTGVLKQWRTGGTERLQKMVDALPETEDLKEMTVVKKYFPRQVRKMQEAGDGASVGLMRKTVSEEGNGDSGCEIDL
ncbi:uncharacterized protein EKO05_0003050 [Ascochyta rabiei]|uniref:uncharacterized protein n=1 Tax=Didymella rabiei TaxID=5454 RepID=UPI0021FBA924|nr:uncharacterized protein EKO05_0003050 [Ascochyta rabiei]UPX12505.1 hypothetical protein EKO05_0003050 [Ascochyta rabiei]